MANEDKGAFGSEPLDAGPEQGGSNLGGLGATGAIDRDRGPEAEGSASRKPASSAREAAIVEEEDEGTKAAGGPGDTDRR